jgi:serine/threonine protein kinase
MELMDGDLAMLMAGTKRAGASPFSLSVAVDIMLQIAKGMLHLHEMEVSHPHLKCDNVLYKLTENKAEAFRVGDVLVKLGGFGCSRPADVNSKGWDILRFGLTCLAILTGDERSDDVSRAHMVPDMVVARSSIPETTPVILKDCIVSCLDMQSTFSDVVKVLLLAKSYLMQASNDEIMFSSESIQTEIVQTKTEGMFADIDYTSRQNLVI